MTRILFCLDFYHPHVGGAETLFQNLAEGLAKRGWDVTVVTQLVPGAQKQEVHNGVTLRRIQTFGLRHLFPLLALPAMLSLARQADLVHTTTFAAAWPAWLAAKVRRKPCLLTVHEVWIGLWNRVSDAGPMSNLLNGFLERTIYWPRFTRYACVSQATARALARQGIPQDKIQVVYNGVDYRLWNPEKHDGAAIRRRLGLDREHFVFLFTGRPGRSKGLPVLLDAFARLNAPNARLLLLLSHSPACKAGLEEAKALAAPQGERVLLLPPVPRQELPDWVMAADCVCVPSLSEGFGFCAAEACAVQRPVIATDNASLPEVVGGRFLLVPPASPAAFQQAMEDALKGAFRQAPVPSFPLRENLLAHEKLYQEILESAH